jgi:hypothetical protein
LYRLLAKAEPDAGKRRLFEQLAAAAESQSGIWLVQIKQQGGTEPALRLTRRARVVGFLIAHLNPRLLRPVLAAMKVRGLTVYSSAAPGHAMPTRIEQVGGRHRGIGSGGNLRAAVFGVNDGLVSNTSDMAGATGEPGLILTTGIAGLGRCAVQAAGNTCRCARNARCTNTRSPERGS